MGMELKDAAKILGTTLKAAASRLAFLGYTVVCSRCGGSGRHSYNQTDGDRCWGCNGKRKMLAPLTTAILNEAATRIASGELVPYFAENKASNSIKTASEAAWATYMGSAVGREYTALSIIDPGRALDSPVGRANDLMAAAIDSVSEATHEREGTALDRMAHIEFAHSVIRTVIAAWATRVTTD